MRERETTTSSKYFRGLKTVRRLFIILLIFHFAGFAAGSCLSYGHSCWGGRRAIPASDSTVVKHLGDRWHNRILQQSGNWVNDYETGRNQLFPNDRTEIDGNSESSKEFDDSVEVTRKMTKPREETTVFIFLPVRKDNGSRRPSYTRKLRLYKILADSTDDAL